VLCGCSCSGSCSVVVAVYLSIYPSPCLSFYLSIRKPQLLKSTTSKNAAVLRDFLNFELDNVKKEDFCETPQFSKSNIKS